MNDHGNWLFIVWVSIFLLFNIPLLSIQGKIINEVNERVPKDERFHFWGFWTPFKVFDLCDLHRKFYPSSSLRTYLGCWFSLALIWVFVGGPLLFR